MIYEEFKFTISIRTKYSYTRYRYVLDIYVDYRYIDDYIEDR